MISCGVGLSPVFNVVVSFTSTEEVAGIGGAAWSGRAMAANRINGEMIGFMVWGVF